MQREVGSKILLAEHLLVRSRGSFGDPESNFLTGRGIPHCFWVQVG